MTDWMIAEPSEGVVLEIDLRAVWLKRQFGVLTDLYDLRDVAPKTRLGSLLATLIPQLIEMGLCTLDRGGIRINHDDFVTLEDYGIDAFQDLVPWSPFTIELESSGSLGWPDFRYKYRFYLGARSISMERCGCFVRWRDQIYRLDKQTFSLIDAIDNFNDFPPGEKTDPKAYISFAKVKGLAEGIGAQLDSFISSQRVLVPPKVGVNILEEENGRISFVPMFDGAPAEAVFSAFMQSDDVGPVHSVVTDGRQGLHIVLDEAQQEVVRKMQKVRHLGGADRAKVLRDPNAQFDGVAEALDLADFGPRVKGIGDFPFLAQPFLQKTGLGIFDLPDDGSLQSSERGPAIGIKCQYIDGETEDILFGSIEELIQFGQAVREAWRNGSQTVDLKGKSLVVDATFLKAVAELINEVAPVPNAEEPIITQRKYVLIYTNESELEYAEKFEGEGGETGLEIPKALKANLELKEHQRIGVAWLQRNYRLNRHGCLLADDMGVGKTLQILTFLAWLIEQGDLSQAGRDFECAPWNPILIVAPVILLENETWQADMRKFFESDGAIFTPWMTLRGSELKRFKRVNAQETAIGEPILDIERLQQYRVILTNYETVVNYQHSFARMKDKWSVVVTDEAQEYKVSSTKISHALKSLSPKFRIASTGTPVETRLLDVWNIFDFLQPGQLLGSAAAFKKQYESPIQDESPENWHTTLGNLKDKLYYGRPDAFILRREKSSLTELPAKNEHSLYCTLSPEQRQLHLDFVGWVRQGKHPLSMIHHMMRLYQHPALVPRYNPLAPDEAIRRSPKLKAVVDCLNEIKSKDEKALIFTRTLDMQQLLANALFAQFGIEVGIVNGASNRADTTRGGNRARSAILSRFRESQGFNVLILSPDVAGMGLTIVEANHVIHYGRWWNPAKESQATDRVYRIGQQKDVHVYYPISTDPEKKFQTFDEKLDALIKRRKSLAADFLAPMPSEDTLGEELLEDLLSTESEEDESFPLNGLSPTDINRLGSDRFGALIGAIQERRNATVILPPQSGNDGIDVISIERYKLRLIRCRHGSLNFKFDVDAFKDFFSACEGYRARYLPSLNRKYQVVPVFATNGGFTNKAQSMAKERKIEMIDNQKLISMLADTPCRFGEIELMECKRLFSMLSVRAALAEMLSLA